MRMFFCYAESIQRDIDQHGEIVLSKIDEEASSGATFPFINVVCRTLGRLLRRVGPETTLPGRSLRTLPSSRRQRCSASWCID